MLPVLSMLITLLGDGVVASSTAVELLAADALGQRRLAAASSSSSAVETYVYRAARCRSISEMDRSRAARWCILSTADELAARCGLQAEPRISVGQQLANRRRYEHAATC